MIRDRLYCSVETGGGQVTDACLRALAEARARGWAPPPPPPPPGFLDGPVLAAALAVLLLAALVALLVLAVRRPGGRP